MKSKKKAHKLYGCALAGPAALVSLVALSGCGGGGGGSHTTTSPFVGTFSGQAQVSQGKSTWTDQFDVAISSAPSIQGYLFQKSNGSTFALQGTANGSSANVTGTDQNHNTLSGTLAIGSNRALNLALTGSDASGALTVSGSAPAISSLNLAGSYNATEDVQFTITAQGQSQSQSTSGSGQITLTQNGGAVSYTVPGTDLSRSGTIQGNLLTLSGPFVEATGSGVVLNQNSVQIKVYILKGTNNEYNFSFTGTGLATGTDQGVPFTISGTSSGTLSRVFAVAVAVLRGGLVGTFDTGSDLDMLRAQAEAVDPTEVVTRGFGAGPLQSSAVQNWLSSPFISQSSGPNQILVGHSLGGGAVEQIDNPNVYSRILIEPISSDLIAQGVYDQRAARYTQTPQGTYGALYNELATDDNSQWPPFNQLLGHHVTGANEAVIPNTDHFSIIPVVQASRLVYNQTSACLNGTPHKALNATRRSLHLRLVGNLARFANLRFGGMVSASH